MSSSTGYPLFIAEMSTFVVSTLRDVAAKPDAPLDVKADWKVIEGWLDCGDRAFTENDREKIRKAWHAYVAIGLAPSSHLQPVFDAMSDELKHDDPPYKDSKVPTEVIDVFGRLLATDLEIKKKRASDIASTKARLQPAIAAPGQNRNGRNWWRGQTLQFRRWVFFAAIWMAVTFTGFAVFDPFHHGAWRYWRGEDLLRMFLILLLPVIAGLLKRIYDRYVK